jgi:hypothetical protein
MARILPALQATGLPVTVVIEREDLDDYRGVIGSSFQMYVLPRSGQGISYARRQILRIAARRDENEIIMCDDDVEPPPNVQKLTLFLGRRRKIAGVGCWFPIYQHFGGYEPNTGPQVHSGAMGKRLIAIRPRRALELGCYSTPLQANDDNDLVMRHLRAGYVPWYIHTDVQGNSLALRSAPGGIESMPGTMEEKNAHDLDLITREFGAGLASYSKRGGIRFSWKKMYQQWHPKIEYSQLSPKGKL